MPSNRVHGRHRLLRSPLRRPEARSTSARASTSAVDMAGNVKEWAWNGRSRARSRQGSAWTRQCHRNAPQCHSNTESTIHRIASTSRRMARAVWRSLFATSLHRPCASRASRLRRKPAAVLGPVLRPPCIRQRPLGMAGLRHDVLRLVLAPHRGAVCQSPGGLPFLNHPRSGRFTRGSTCLLSSPCMGSIASP